MVPAFRLRTINPTISNRTTVRTETNPPMAQQAIKHGKRKFQDIHIPYAPEWGSRYQIKTIGPLNGSIHVEERDFDLAGFHCTGVVFVWTMWVRALSGALSRSWKKIFAIFYSSECYVISTNSHHRSFECWKNMISSKKKRNNITMP